MRKDIKTFIRSTIVTIMPPISPIFLLKGQFIQMTSLSTSSYKESTHAGSFGFLHFCIIHIWDFCLHSSIIKVNGTSFVVIKSLKNYIKTKYSSEK